MLNIEELLIPAPFAVLHLQQYHEHSQATLVKFLTQKKIFSLPICHSNGHIVY